MKQRLINNSNFPDGHARADRGADEAQADVREAPQAARAGRAHPNLQDPRIFSAVICCAQLLARLYAIDKTTTLSDPATTTAILFLILYKRGYKTAIAVAILLHTDAIATALSVGNVLILFLKPCDVYTFAVIASILVRMFIVNLRVTFNVLLSFCSDTISF